MAAASNQAELPLNTVLLIDLFKQFNANVNKLQQDWQVAPLNDGNRHPGLYMIVVTDIPRRFEENLQKLAAWPEPAPSGEMYEFNIIPLYFGETSDLRSRFLQHRNERREGDFAGKFTRNRDGVSGITLGTWTCDDLDNIFVFYIEMPKLVAKWMESVFLDHFEFAFNTQEQVDDNVRYNLVNVEHTDMRHPNAQQIEVYKEEMRHHIDAMMTELDTNYNQLTRDKQNVVNGFNAIRQQRT